MSVDRAEDCLWSTEGSVRQTDRQTGGGEDKLRVFRALKIMITIMIMIMSMMVMRMSITVAMMYVP
jgi:hypothetical protein